MLLVNLKPKRTAAALCGFLATACFLLRYQQEVSDFLLTIRSNLPRFSDLQFTYTIIHKLLFFTYTTCALRAVADWQKRTALFIPVCFVSPDDSTTLPTNDVTYVFQHHDDQR